MIGLSAAVRLREAGVDANVVAARRGAATTSSVAAALWYPYRALPQDRVRRWSAETYSELSRLAQSEPGAGVRLVRGRELVREPGEPWWRDAVPALAHADPPPGYRDAWELTLPVADTTRYLPWLEERLASLGGRIAERRLGSLDEALDEAPVAVNCAGLAAAELAGDEDVTPVRGQVVVVQRPAGIDEWLLDAEDDRLTYVVPRTDTVVLGGTAEVGSTDPEPDAATAEAIVRRTAALVPAVADARVVAHRVGIRPGRSSVRLEAEQLDRGIVVHCYGHGGAGVTLSWGCAAEVARLYADAV